MGTGAGGGTVERLVSNSYDARERLDKENTHYSSPE